MAKKKLTYTERMKLDIDNIGFIDAVDHIKMQITISSGGGYWFSRYNQIWFIRWLRPYNYKYRFTYYSDLDEKYQKAFDACIKIFIKKYYRKLYPAWYTVLYERAKKSIRDIRFPNRN